MSKTDFLFAQAPNRKGNQSTRTPSQKGGVTDQPYKAPKVQTHGVQGPADASGVIHGANKQPVRVSTPKCYDKTPDNSGYMSKSTKNWER